MIYKNKVIALFILVSICGASNTKSAQQKIESVDPSWIKEANKVVVYSLATTKKIKEKENLIYKQVGDIKLMLNVYSPNVMDKKLPVIILVHGGPVPENLKTQPKDWGIFTSYGRLLAASGFVAITFNYRLHDTNSYKNADNDIAELINYVRKNAGSLGIDKNKVFPWFFSGGGVFVAPMLRDSPDYIRGIISYYPVLDIKYFKNELPVSTTKEIINRYSASFQMNNINKTSIPMLIARAGLDSPEINKFIDDFTQIAISKNMALEFINHSKGLHGFDNDRNAGEDRTKDIIKRTINFIKENSGQE